ncbi:MAG: hypothetical protein IPJ61_11680 [Tessaracoccus sp.]|uniref:cell division protein PerM n=1 Tax=Tessaracoccus sp. TaxID=1971211 RepID=UPI001EBD3E27|nr:DUF6350 family protein [Tessaracoccus sp.]MBK7821701.1 hypothetical protein [Tessaracoccus sp.]
MASRKPRTVAVDVDAAAVSGGRRMLLPWYLMAVIGPLATLVAVWLILAALATIGWLTSPAADLGAALRLATQLLLLAHGGAASIGGQSVTLAPLGVTVLLVFLALPMASIAARQAAADRHGPDDTGRVWADAEALTLRVAAVFGGTYALVVIVLAGVLGLLTAGLLLGAVVVAAVAALWGASRGVGYDPTDSWPGWLRAVPRALGAALLVVVAGAAAVLAVALWQGRARVTEMVAALDGGWPAVVLLVVLHLIYLPNLVLACASWALGAGVTLGDGSLVTLNSTDLGLLPAVPVLGALPQPGPVPWQAMLWLLVGVAAGALAGVVVAAARPRARFDETAVVGGLAGTAAGLLVAVACALGAGGLGTDRLAAIGARSPEIFLFAPSILGLAGLAAGLAVGLIRRPPAAAVAQEADAKA